MITDSTQVLFNGAISETGKPVSLNGLTIPGKMNPIPMGLWVQSEIKGPTTSLDIKLQQSADGKSSWEDVPGSAVSILAKDYAVLGRVKDVKYLPRTVTKPFIKAVVSAGGGGALTSGNIFFGLFREDPEMYEAGLYINKGQVQG